MADKLAIGGIKLESRLLSGEVKQMIYRQGCQPIFKDGEAI
jgi:hypothetical protein